MVQVELDMSYDAFCAKGVELQDGMDVTSHSPTFNGIAPHRLVVKVAEGPGGGNPICVAHFRDGESADLWLKAFDPDGHEPGVSIYEIV